MRGIFNTDLAKCYVIDNMEQRNTPNWTAGCSFSENIIYRGTKSLFFGSLNPTGITIPKTGDLSSKDININADYKSGYRTFSLLMYIDSNLADDITGIKVKMFYDATNTEVELLIPKEFSRRWFILRWKYTTISGLLKKIQIYHGTSVTKNFYIKDLAVSNAEVKTPVDSKFRPNDVVEKCIPCGDLSVPPNFKERWSIRSDDGTIPNLYGSIFQETGHKPRDIGLVLWDRHQDTTQTEPDSILFKTRQLLSKNVYYLNIDENGTWYPIKILGAEPSKKKNGMVYFVDLDALEYTEIGGT